MITQKVQCLHPSIFTLSEMCMFSFPGSESDNYKPDEGRRHKELIPEEDHVEGLKFLAERDMRSLHKVTNCV